MLNATDQQGIPFNQQEIPVNQQSNINLNKSLSGEEQTTNSIGQKMLRGLGALSKGVEGLFSKKKVENLEKEEITQKFIDGASQQLKIEKQQIPETEKPQTPDDNIKLPDDREEETEVEVDEGESEEEVNEEQEVSGSTSRSEDAQRQKDLRFLGSTITADNIGKALLVGGAVTLSVGVLAALSVATMGGGLPVIALAALLICGGGVMLGYGGVALSGQNQQQQIHHPPEHKQPQPGLSERPPTPSPRVKLQESIAQEKPEPKPELEKKEGELAKPTKPVKPDKTLIEENNPDLQRTSQEGFDFDS